MLVTVLKKRWRLRFCRLKDRYGDCDPPDQPGKEIRICTGLSEQKELEVLLHEMLHCADWQKSEEFVEHVADDITRVLTKLGWRKTKE